MKGHQFRKNHYVPEWYQRRFLMDDSQEQKFHFLDLHPDLVTGGDGIRRPRKQLNRWGPSRCFYQDDLYTTFFGRLYSTEIERKFFGGLDAIGPALLDEWEAFAHPNVLSSFEQFLGLVSVQKLRTPRGLDELSSYTGIQRKLDLLLAMQRLAVMYCAVWTEAVWAFVDAGDSPTKFILSDTPVTIYNRSFPPASAPYRAGVHPDIRSSGSHTIFPLSCNRALVLTNLSWVRNPYTDGKNLRPNPGFLRDSIFNFQEIQTGRMLSEHEVREFNYVIKNGARRFIAAAQKEWLYPEHFLIAPRWDRLGDGHLFMPDPRAVSFTNQVLIGYTNGGAAGFDEYGRQRPDRTAEEERRREREWTTFHRFQAEFAQVHGPERRGQSHQYGRLDPPRDSDDYHQHWQGYLPKDRRKDFRSRPTR